MPRPDTYRESSQNWLGNFDASDRPVAASFLGELLLISHDEFCSGLRRTLETFLASVKVPIALFAAREPTSEPYFSNAHSSHKPSATASTGGIGSEGDIAHFIRDFAREHRREAVFDHPSIDEMRVNRVRKVLIVDDIIGSGERARKFARWIAQNQTLRSWLSYGWVRLVPASYAATDAGKAALESTKSKLGVERVLAYRIVEHGRSTWNQRERETFESLCRRYAEKAGRKYMPLGYQNAMTMLVFQHKCPNTCPPIIWSRSPNWVPLFAARPEFSFDEWPDLENPENRLQIVLKSLGQLRLSKLQWTKYVSLQAKQRFFVLAVLSKRRLDIGKLSAAVALSVEDCRTLVGECQLFGWLTTNLRVTDAGRKELKYAKQIELVIEPIPSLTDHIYVPQSFRGGPVGSSSTRRISTNS